MDVVEWIASTMSRSAQAPTLGLPISPSMRSKAGGRGRCVREDVGGLDLGAQGGHFCVGAFEGAQAGS